MIIEAMGRPADHLVDVLNEICDNISKEKGVELTERKVNEPKAVKDKKDLFTTFAEIEVSVEEPLILALLMFKYMPAHVEVIEPENFTLGNNDYGELLTEITRRLHKYDELARIMQMEKEILTNKIKKLEEKK
ncbi:MAG: hypothetical protein PF542_00120 [Nanoarchaeota archaeon]|nr:hypothetical protein [Nanoarchaeota archaeon]